MFQGTSLSALSPSSLALSLTASVMWTTYGFAVSQFPVWSCSLVMGALTLVVLVRRCPPRRVAVALHRGAWGPTGQLLVRPLVLAHRATQRAAQRAAAAA